MDAKLIVSAWNRFWFQPTSTSGVCLFRIFYGLASFANGLLWIPDFPVWFGTKGAVPTSSLFRELQPSLTLWNWYHPANDAATYGVLALYILFGLLVAAGLWTRFSIFITWFLLISIYHRDPLFWHSETAILAAVAPPLFFAPAGERFSLDTWIRRRRDSWQPDKLHAPWAQRLLQFQLACVYFRAFFAKLYGSMWLNGTAVYYATVPSPWAKFGLPPMLHNSVGYRLATWGTLVIELSLFTLVWSRKFRYWVLMVGVLFHLLINWSLNIDLLEWTVILSYVVWIYPDDLDRVLSWVRRHLTRAFPWARAQDQQAGNHI